MVPIYVLDFVPHFWIPLESYNPTLPLFCMCPQMINLLVDFPRWEAMNFWWTCLLFFWWWRWCYLLGIGWTQIMSFHENIFYHHRVTLRQNANLNFSVYFGGFRLGEQPILCIMGLENWDLFGACHGGLTVVFSANIEKIDKNWLFCKSKLYVFDKSVV